MYCSQPCFRVLKEQQVMNNFHLHMYISKHMYVHVDLVSRNKGPNTELSLSVPKNCLSQGADPRKCNGGANLLGNGNIYLINFING